MKTARARRTIATATTLGLLAMAVVASPAAAADYRQVGEGRQFYTSWTEYDLDDSLGLPGNVHLGYLSGWSDQWGTYMYGNVTDFDCDEGEIPGWGGHGIEETVSKEAARAADAAVEDAIDAVIDSGASRIKGESVRTAVREAVRTDVPAAIVEIFEEEVEYCDYVQDRFLDGTETATFTVDIVNAVATVTGTLTVTGGHGDHGEPGEVLGRPPVNLTITGGEWQQSKGAYAFWGADYRYEYSSEGTDIFGGTVSGAIGAMGFDDDADDTSFGGFGSYRYKTVEKIRN